MADTTTTSSTSSSPAAVKRLQAEYRDFTRERVPYIDASPTDDIFVWLFVLTGTPESVYAGGEYVGRLTFPSNYPFEPPKIEMLTPSGRFITNMRLCLSISDYHPESWSPAWTVTTILLGVMSFMNDSASTTGSLNTSDADKRRLAKTSQAFNKTLPEYVKYFPERELLTTDSSPSRCLHACSFSPNPVISRTASPANAVAPDNAGEEYYLEWDDDDAEDEENAEDLTDATGSVPL